MRADDNLEMAVRSELAWRFGVDEAAIGVTADDGVVTMAGHVDRRSDRESAEDAVLSVFGVRGVANDVRLGKESLDPGDAVGIAKAAVEALVWSSELPHTAITVVAVGSHLTLAGTVAWPYERAAAERCVRSLHGVDGVTNDIVVKLDASAVNVTAEIGRAFHRGADLELLRVHVTTKGGTVILEGTTATATERSAAAAAAWSAPGVTSVVNRIVLAA